jgi:hypothetical protein
MLNWKTSLMNAILFFFFTTSVSVTGTSGGEKNQLLELIIKSCLFAVAHHVILQNFPEIQEGFSAGDSKPDSRNTSCAMGSVPGENGLDCKIPTDRYGL